MKDKNLPIKLVLQKSSDIQKKTKEAEVPNFLGM